MHTHAIGRYLPPLAAIALTSIAAIGTALAGENAGRAPIRIPQAFALDPPASGLLEEVAKRDSISASESPVFSYLRWRSGVVLYQVTGRYPFKHIAILDDTKCALAPQNVGHFLAGVDTPQKAVELALYFHEGLLFFKEADIAAFAKAAHGTPAAADAFAVAPPVDGAWDSEQDCYDVRFHVYESRCLKEARYSITRTGLIGYQSQKVVSGPPPEAGWDGPTREFEAYAAKVATFEEAVAPVLEHVAATTLAESALDQRGMFKARLNALRWLVEASSLSAHSQQVRAFLLENDRRVPGQLHARALQRLEAIGGPLPQSE